MEKDPGSFTIPYDIGQLHIENALADLGASISLMSYMMYKKLGLGEPKATRMGLELADRSIQYPRGIIESVLIKVDKFILPIDFVILDMPEDSRITLRVGDDEVIFDLDQSIKRPATEDDECYRIDDLDDTINEEAQELLVNEEPDSFLSRGLEKSIDQSDLKCCESASSNENDGLNLENSICHIDSTNTSYLVIQGATKGDDVKSEHLYSASANEIDEKKPELKNLPQQLEYTYLHGDKSFPIIISSELSEKEKISLLQDSSKYQSLQRIKKRLPSLVLIGLSLTDKCHLDYIKDKKGAENLAADHLSKVENPDLGTFTEEKITDEFPNEHLMILKAKLNNDEPWYADYVNYVVGKILCSDNVMRRCVAGNEILEILAHCHSGPTRGHHSASITGRKVYESVDYVSKWVKAQALPTNDARIVIRFLRRLFTRFEVPKALISERGTYFYNSQLEKTLHKYGVTHKLSTAYHLQTNGQTEVTNRAIKRILERSVGYNPKNWSEKLDDALWAFRTAYKTPTGCTPFRFVYGKACHLPVEIEHKAYWALKQCNMDLTAAAKNHFMELNELMKFKMHPGKLKSKWYGPNVVKIMHPYGIVEIIDKNGISFKVNGQRLKKYHDGHINAEKKEVVELDDDTTIQVGGFIAPATAEEKAQRRLELKARSTLLIGIPNQHQLKFNSIKDAKSLLQPIEKSSEVLYQTFDRLQKLISQLEIHGDSISQEDVNQKFLRSLSPEWNTHTIVWRNKPDIEILSLDDLYNNLKIYEPEVKDTSSSKEMHLRWQMAMLTMRARRFLKKTGRKFFVNDTETIGFDKSKVECYNCHKIGHFARECRALRNQENRNREYTRIDVDVYDQVEEGPTNFALMAYSSTSSNSEVSTDSNCSSSCLENVKILKEQNEQLLKDLRASKINAITSKTGLESVEARLLGVCLGYNAVPPPYTGNFMPPKPDLPFSGLEEFMNEPIVSESTVKKLVVESSEAKASADKSKIVRKNNSALIIEDWVPDSKEEDLHQAKIEKKTIKPSFAKIEFVKSKEQGNPQQDLQDKGVIDHGCSRYMTGNMSYLTDFEEIDGGYVTFEGNPKGGKITGKGTKACDDVEDDEKKITEEPRKEGDDSSKEDKSNDQEKDDNVNITNNVNTASTNEVNVVGAKTSIELPTDLYMPELKDIVYSDDDEDVGSKADMNNLDTFMPVSPIPTTRVHKDHPVEQIIRDLNSAPQTRIMTKNLKELGLFNSVQQRTSHKDFQNCLFACFLSQEEPKKVIHTLKDPSWIEAMQLSFYNLSLQGSLDFGLQVKQKEDGVFISQDKYVTEILKKFGFTGVKTASTHMETQKPLLKDEDGEEVDVHLYRSMIGSFSLRPDIIYLKGQPKLGLWYPKDSPFDLVAYTDSDYAGASLDRKSTTGEAEYVAASSCCGQEVI
ncbi:reverse transcriptase domain-containing protein [Tanacetum coccineum]|uniref:Reverse transcriptase domain-containing protein n=1 Tax=Tanacetum coccineum TaxID=301880 RepID=A0ABQ5J8M7_9ASTR